MQIEDIGEFGLIEALARLLPEGEGVVKGIGDDAAVLAGRRRDSYLLLATDSIAEGVHFRRRAAGRRVGRKALAVNLSDIAAMGGLPLWAVVNLGLPAGTPVRYCREIYRGMAELAEEFSLSVVGGDTFRSPGGIVISVTVAGEVEKNRCVLRSGARPGDVICLTGRLGDPPRDKHLDFTPRIREARFLGESTPPTAMIDLSDGLFADLDRLCRASGVGAVIGESSLPVLDSVRRRGTAAVIRTAGKGEEFELLVCLAPPAAESLCPELEAALGTPLTPIGRIVADPGRLELIDRRGIPRPLPATGYQHFR